MVVQFKDILIQPLPLPTSEGLNQPGFHFRTVKAEDGERKYSVFVPNGYDGQKSFPVVLFLHGSGERGTDGITSAQVFGDRLHVWIDHGDARAAQQAVERAAQLAGITATSIRSIVPSLEDVFIARLAS